MKSLTGTCALRFCDGQAQGSLFTLDAVCGLDEDDHLCVCVTFCCWCCAGSSVTSESRFLSADQPEGEWQVVLPRVNNVEYDVKHRGDHFFIEIRDEDRPNSEVLVAPVSDPTQTKVVPQCHLVGLSLRHNE